MRTYQVTLIVVFGLLVILGVFFAYRYVNGAAARDIIAAAQSQNPALVVDEATAAQEFERAKIRIDQELFASPEEDTAVTIMPECLGMIGAINECTQYLADHPALAEELTEHTSTNPCILVAQETADVKLLAQRSCESITSPVLRNVCKNMHACDELKNGFERAVCTAVVQQSKLPCKQHHESLSEEDEQEEHDASVLGCGLTLAAHQAFTRGKESCSMLGGILSYACVSVAEQDCGVLRKLIAEYTWLHFGVCERISDPGLVNECKQGHLTYQKEDLELYA